MSVRLQLLVDEEDGRVLLRSPEVGFFTCALPPGTLLGPGARAGVLRALGRSFELAVPAGVSGRVVTAAPELVLAPVGYGTLLYELEALPTGAAGARPAAGSAPAPAGARTSGLVFRAPHSGRFWQRPAPHDPPFVRAGDVIGEGQTIGLIEVMKTFTQLAYHATGSGASPDALPPRARILRLCVEDGVEVADGAPLIELEPA